MMSKKQLRSHCPINFGLESFGDKWSLLIIRDIVFRGKRTYGEFLKSGEGFSTNILASRLEQLEESGIIKKSPHPDDSRKDIYTLTEKGLDLMPMLFEMILWSFKYDAKSEARRVLKLVERIRADNRNISAEMIKAVREGRSVLSIFVNAD